MTTKRRFFTGRSSREAVALLESSGRPLEHVAEELGIPPQCCATSGGGLPEQGGAQRQRLMESFFGTAKSELVHHQRHPTREAAKRDLFADIEGYDNRQRLHSALGYITPEQAELRAA